MREIQVCQVGQVSRGESRQKTGGEGGKERDQQWAKAKLREGGRRGDRAARHRPVRRARLGVGSGRENEEKVEVRKVGRGYGWGTTR